MNYKIGGVFLYDGQTNIDYIILSNEIDPSNRYYYLEDFILGLDSDIGYFMDDKVIVIKNNDILTHKFIRKTDNPKYNVYDRYWNETKSGINLFDYYNEYMSTVQIIDGEMDLSRLRIHYRGGRRECIIKKILS